MAPKIIRSPYIVGQTVVSLSQAKDHLRVDHDDEDTLIGAYLSAAASFVSEYTERALTIMDHTVVNDCWMDSFTVPQTDNLDDFEVNYINNDGVLTAFTDFNLSTLTGKCVMLSTPSDISDEHSDAVQITYRAGYGSVGIPSGLHSAVLLILGHLYENRQDVTGFQQYQLPQGAQALMQPYKLYK